MIFKYSSIVHTRAPTSSAPPLEYSVLSHKDKARDVAEITPVPLEAWVRPGLTHAAISWLPALGTYTACSLNTGGLILQFKYKIKKYRWYSLKS